MAGTLKHAKTSGKAAPTDTTKVGGPDWDADHNFAGGALGSLLYRDTGATDGANWLADVATGSVLVSGGVGAAPAWSATPTLTSATFGSGSSGPAAVAVGASNVGLFSAAANTLNVTANGTNAFSFAAAGVRLIDTGSIGWSSNPGVASPDVLILRDAANTLAQRNSTTAQIFRLYGTFTDSSNYERLGIIAQAAAAFDIVTAAAGTGTVRPLRFGSGAAHWSITSSGHLTAISDNSYDIGASGATRPRNLFLGGTLTLSGGTLLATSAALTNGAAAATGTLTNAPTAGNPTKWIPINDNGTTRYIPAW